MSNDNDFYIVIRYKNEPRVFEASLGVMGYTHKINVDVDGQNIIFEPDEERNYRAVLHFDDMDKMKSVDVELVKKIGERIEEILK